MVANPFKPAIKTAVKLRMAITGPSGTGKTYTALSIATNLGKTAVIDTEHNSAIKYANLFQFDLFNLTNYHPHKFIQLINAAAENGYEVLLIDSLSHAWNGKGGILEIVDQAKKQKRNEFTAWGDATPIQNDLIEAILSANIHIIATMRSKTEYVLEEDERGKKVPRKVGMSPIQRDGVEYEFDIHGEMSTANEMRIVKTRCPELYDAVIMRPGMELAATLHHWLNDGEPAPIGNFTPPSNVTTLPTQQTGKTKPNWVTTPNIDKILEVLNSQGLTDSDIFRLMQIAPDQKYGDWWWQFETGKAAKDAILKAQADEMSNLPPAQPKSTPPPQKENVWTDFDEHTLDELASEYGLGTRNVALSELGVDGWRVYANPKEARAALKEYVVKHALRLNIAKVTYHKQFTDLHCGDISVRAYGRDHFRSIEGSIIAQECEAWEEGKSYTITEPEILYIQANKWSHKGNNLDGYYIVENGGVKVDIPF